MIARRSAATDAIVSSRRPPGLRLRVQEKTFCELKGEFALDVVPTRHYGANSAWQQLSILAHNVARSFQLDTLAEPKARSKADLRLRAPQHADAALPGHHAGGPSHAD